MAYSDQEVGPQEEKIMIKKRRDSIHQWTDGDDGNIQTVCSFPRSELSLGCTRYEVTLV